MLRVGNNYIYIIREQVSLKPKLEKDTTKKQNYQSKLLVLVQEEFPFHACIPFSLTLFYVHCPSPVLELLTLHSTEGSRILQLKVTASIKPWKKKFCITFEDFSWLWKYVVSHWGSNQIEMRRQKLSGWNQLATKCQKEDSQVSSVCPHSFLVNLPHTLAASRAATALFSTCNSSLS